MLLAGEGAITVPAAAVAPGAAAVVAVLLMLLLLNAARGLPQPALMVHVPSYFFRKPNGVRESVGGAKE